MKNLKKVTAQDIANELGLSRNTVTKALNGGSVSYETRLQVIKKAYELGYSKLSDSLLEEMEQSSAKVENQTILVLSNRNESPFWSKVLAGISDELNKQQYRMQLHILDENETNADETLRILRPDVAGIIFLSIFSKEFILGMNQAKLPITYFDSPVDAETYLEYGNIVLLEGKDSVRKLVSQVIRQGKRRLAFIGDITYSKIIHDRYLGFLQAMEEHNIPVDQSLLFTNHVPIRYYSYKEIEDIVSSMKELPEGFICVNDDIAKYVVMAINKYHGGKLEQLVVTGYDDNLDRDLINIPIPTVRINKEAVGVRLANTVVESTKHPEWDHVMIFLKTYLENNE